MSGGCVRCGSTNLVAKAEPITVKRRSKFGVIWILLTIFTGGLAFILWLIWPRHHETVGVDRYVLCMQCGMRQ